MTLAAGSDRRWLAGGLSGLLSNRLHYNSIEALEGTPPWQLAEGLLRTPRCQIEPGLRHSLRGAGFTPQAVAGELRGANYAYATGESFAAAGADPGQAGSIESHRVIL